jgi:hypothetical protein
MVAVFDVPQVDIVSKFFLAFERPANFSRCAVLATGCENGLPPRRERAIDF